MRIVSAVTLGAVLALALVGCGGPAKKASSTTTTVTTPTTSTASSSTTTASGTTPPTTAPAVITMKVSGTGRLARSITVVNGTHKTETLAVRLPYETTIPYTTSVVAVAGVATGTTKSTAMRCEIDVPGKSPIVKKATGKAAAAVCSTGPLPLPLIGRT